jgi:aryl-alcohol dehydrogenase-like predicted oxidoreductase
MVGSHCGHAARAPELEKYVTVQMYYSLVGRGLEYEFQSFAAYHNIGILVWSPIAGWFLTSKYSRANLASAGTRFAEAGAFMPFDKGATAS